MQQLKERIAHLREWIKTPRAKKMMYMALVLIIIGWVVFRFVMIGVQNRIQVFNPTRHAATDGVPVSVVTVSRTSGVVREPLTVKNNRAYVSGVRATALRAGQKIGDGVIVSVAQNVDLDTGMHAVRTRGVSDGLQYAEFRADGYFVPVYAVSNGIIYVLRDGHAVATPVTVSRSDSDMAYITSGLGDGDVVILSRVADGAKVQVKE